MELLILRILSPLTYFISSWFFLKVFVDRRAEDIRNARIAENSAVVIHTLLLGIISFRNGHLPLADPFQALSSFMWFFVVLNKVIIREKKEYTLGVFHTSIIGILQTISVLFMSPETPLPPILQNVLFEVHVVVNLIGYAAFSHGFLAAVMYTLLFHEINSNKLGYFYDRLPSLSYLENLTFRVVLTGFIFNSLGILLGSYTGKSAWGSYWAWDPKLIAVVISWLLYGIALLGRWRLHWQGTRLAYITISGFIWIIFSMLIISNFFSKMHSFN